MSAGSVIVISNNADLSRHIYAIHYQSGNHIHGQGVIHRNNSRRGLRTIEPGLQGPVDIRVFDVIANHDIACRQAHLPKPSHKPVYATVDI